MALDRSTLIAALTNAATRLRIDSVRSTSEAGSGHPTSCCSAADVVAALFFAEMRFDPKAPHHPLSDRFVLSKGHAAPLLYAAWAEAGAFDRGELLKLRTIGSDLEGHPTPRLPFVDVATGSLGQGICAADRLRAERAPDRIGLPHLRARRRRRERGRLGVGGGRRRGHGRTRQPVRRHRRQRARPEPADDVAPRHGAVRAPLARVRLARDRRGRPRHGRDPRRVRRGAPHQGPADDDPRADDQGQGRVVRRGTSGLARQAVQEGRRREPRARRAREAVRSRAGRHEPGARNPETAGRPGPGSGAQADGAARLQAGRPGRDPRSVRRGDRQARRSRPARRRARRGREELDVQRQVRESAAGAVLPELHRRAGDDRRGDGPGRARRDSVPVDLRVLPVARGGLHPHGRDQQRGREDGRLARRYLDWRGRSVADGARGSRDVLGAAQHRGALSVRRGQRRAARRARRLPSGSCLHPHEPPEDAGHLSGGRDVRRRRPEGPARERGRRRHGHRRRRDGVRGAEGVRPARRGGHRDPRDRSLLGGAGRSRTRSSPRAARPADI